MKKLMTLFKSVIFSFAVYMWFLGSSLVVEIDSRSREEALHNLFESHQVNLTKHINKYCSENFLKKSSEKANNENSSQDQERLLEARKEKTIRDNLIYLPELRQVWCLVPKAASTSWSHKIIESLNLHQEKLQNDLRNASIPIQVFLRKHFGNIGTKLYRELAGSTTVKKILLTRHPFSRLISAFEDKLKNRKAKDDSMYFFSHYGVKINRAFRRNRRTNKRKEPIFEEFVEYLIQTDPIDYDEHWKPISLLCGPCKVHFDHIIKQEELDTGPKLNFHLEKLNFGSGDKREIQRDNVTPREFAKMGDYFKNISKTQIDLLYRKYEDDFNLFSYDLNFLR